MAESANDQAEGPLDRLKAEAAELIGAFGEHAFSSLKDKVEDTTGRLTDYATGAATPGVKAAVEGVKSHAQGKGTVSSVVSAGTAAVKEKVGNLLGKDGGGEGGGGDNSKVTNIVEWIDVGVSIKLAYDQWTQFTEFPGFMKKVENVEQEEDQKLTWRAQVLWSHRTWESTILEQVPEDKIVWRSQGDKGYVDGAVTFHELAPNLTRILVILEYHPKGFFEHVGNLWRAQGRRVRLELKYFQRHVMTGVLLHPDEVEGWRGVISEGEVQQQRTRRGTGTKGKKDEDGKGSTGTRRTTARRASSGRTASGRAASSPGSASQGSTSGSRSGGTGSRSRSSAGSGTKTAASRSAASGASSGAKPRQTTSRAKKAASQ